MLALGDGAEYFVLIARFWGCSQERTNNKCRDGSARERCVADGAKVEQEEMDVDVQSGISNDGRLQGVSACACVCVWVCLHI